MSARLVTTLGELAADQVGWMLAHEHVFANFHADESHNVQAWDVATRMIPELERARDVGITALVEATAVGAAREPELLLALSQGANLPILAATGIFKEPAKTLFTQTWNEETLRDWMIRELTVGIDATRIRAGWIKLSVTDSGVQPHEETLIRAAAAASRATGAVVGIHTVGAALANAGLDLFEAAGGSPDRFIWIHTQTEPDVTRHEAFARRGAWIEYDAISDDRPDDDYVQLVMRALDEGYAERVLLSQDRIGYDPAQPNGGTFKPYTTLIEQFLPKLRNHGVDEAALNRLLRDNPFRAYAR